ncbi:MAG TPA: 50S ribosomal protein L21 [Terriglobales bacterium]
MYAVIRAGGKQYRVSPGDVVRVERSESHVGAGDVSFDVLAVSAGDGQISKPSNAKVLGQVLGEGRGDKILVFKFKRKKQYKKLQGHRQGYADVRISQISFDGQKFDAPALPEKKVKAPKKAEAVEETKEAAPKKKAAAKKTAAKKAPAKKTAAKKSSSKKK